jgi:hypothetical protein
MHRVNIGKKAETQVGGFEVLSEKKVHETAKKALITHTVQYFGLNTLLTQASAKISSSGQLHSGMFTK